MIRQAAIKVGDDIWTLPRPARHHNILWAMHDVLHGSNPSQRPQLIEGRGIQGFIDHRGWFYDRQAAADYAAECGQLQKPLDAPPNLYSEDLW